MNKETRGFVLGLCNVFFGLYMLEMVSYNKPLWYNILIAVVSFYWVVLGYVKVKKSNE